MYGLTPPQRRCLALLAIRQRQGDICPTIRELGRDLNLQSTSVIDATLRALEERGAIRRLHQRVRAIEVLPDGLASIPPIEIAGERFRFIPLSMVVASGNER